METTIEMNALHFLRALTYANRAIPKDDAKSRMQHLVMIGNRLIGADGERWHVGILDEEIDIPPMAIARQSVLDLKLDLEHARRRAKRYGGSFSVELEIEDEETARAKIVYGAPTPLICKLAVLNLGKLPTKWKEPVEQDAPSGPVTGELRTGHLQEAMKWHRSWEKDHGTCHTRGRGGDEPLRIDIEAGGELVATAILLPIKHVPAQLPLDDNGQADLYRKPDGRSQSILDLDLTGDGQPDPQRKTILVNGVSIDATGIPVPEDMIVTIGEEGNEEGLPTSCAHRSVAGECVPCTEEKIASVRRAQRLAEEREEDADEAEQVASRPRPSPRAGKKKKSKK